MAGEVYGSFAGYERQIAASGCGDRIHLFNYYIDDEEVPVFFSAADVCILSYKSATQSGIASVANHFDLPLIATDVGGLKETIAHGETGLIVDSPEAGPIAEAVRTFFDNGLKMRFAENIRKEKQENSWENFARKTIAFCAEVSKKTK